MSQWFVAEPMSLLLVVVSTVSLYALVVACARASGVRSFAEMSTFDMVVAVIIGSLVATVVVSKNPPLAQGVVAVITLYAVQLGVSRLRAVFRPAERMFDNQPILLMGAGGAIKLTNMRVAGVTEDDLRSHLRAANVSDPATVTAVVMEGTGTINVLHGTGHALGEDDWILRGVRDYEVVG